MKKRLFKSFLFISFLLITFFCIKIDSYASSFAYSDFNWEEFSKQNKNYWVSGCEEDDDNCEDRVLKTKKNFYTKLYSLLAEYERKGYKIDDNIIIETVFYGLTPDSFADAGTRETEYEGQEYEYGYNIDNTEDSDKYIATDEGDKESAKEYFKKETDTLKTLMNNMIGYTRDCYGVSSEKPYTATSEDGKSYLTCSNSELTVLNGKCVAKISSLKTDYFDTIGLGIFSSNNVEKKCKELSKDYSSYYLSQISENGVNEELYWDFLINNDYFDNKFQLQSYFQEVLVSTGHDKMSELNDSEYKEYEEEIIEARTIIVNNIKGILEFYGEFAETPSSSGSSAGSTNYWWPIGGSSIETVGDTKMAVGDPISTTITSKFGLRTDPVTGVANSTHSGLDIAGQDGVTPIISALNGTVVKSAQGITGTCVNGDLNCGGKYGNYIIIQHTDGNYTLYAHMATNSVIVQEGDTVKQGQVIGYVGNTGKSTGPHLHFEVRVGGNDYSSVQDPLNFISVEDPRATYSGGTMSEWIAVLEGGTRQGTNYVVEDAGDGYKTFGPGIVTVFNADAIRAHGINPDALDYGSLVPIKTGDAIFADVLTSHVNSVKKKLSSSGINVSDNQLSALVSLEYNCGNINGFAEAYQKYGVTQQLCTNWWNNKALHDGNGRYYAGLAKRRVAECDLFVNGNYNMNPYG